MSRLPFPFAVVTLALAPSACALAGLHLPHPPDPSRAGDVRLADGKLYVRGAPVLDAAFQAKDRSGYSHAKLYNSAHELVLAIDSNAYATAFRVEFAAQKLAMMDPSPTVAAVLDELVSNQILVGDRVDREAVTAFAHRRQLDLELTYPVQHVHVRNNSWHDLVMYVGHLDPSGKRGSGDFEEITVRGFSDLNYAVHVDGDYDLCVQMTDGSLDHCAKAKPGWFDYRISPDAEDFEGQQL